MKATGIVALSLLGLAAAAPYKHMQHGKDKRDIVWVTETAEVVETVLQTTTVWVDPTEEAQEYTPTPTPEPTTVEETTSSTPTPEPTTSSTPTPEPTTSSTSVYTPPAPTTTSTTPTSTYTPPPATTQAPSSTSTYVAPTSSAVATSSAVVAAESTSSSSLTGAVAGDKDNCEATWYNTLGAYAACGTQHNDDEFVVALKSSTFNTYKSDICGKKLTLEYKGKTTTATLVDSCPGCNGEWDIDLSPPVFEALTGDLGVGRISGLTWHFD